MLVAKHDIKKEDMNAADECNDALRSPLLRLCWACCQTGSDGSMHMLSEKLYYYYYYYYYFNIIIDDTRYNYRTYKTHENMTKTK